jgi:hypothetical protein
MLNSDGVLFADAEIHDAGAMGYGVFARRPFAAGEAVEVCPVLLIEMPYADLPLETKDRVFNWGYLTAGDNSQKVHALAGGCGGIYNDNNPANLRFEAVPNKLLLRFIAARDIEKDEQLSINYSGIGGSHKSEDDHWWDGKGKVPIRW